MYNINKRGDDKIKRWNKEQIIEYINNFGYEVLDIKLVKNQKTIGLKSIATIKCPYCGEEFEVVIDKFVNRNKRCWCENHYTVKKIESLFIDSEYTLVKIIKFSKSTSRLLVKCPNPNHEPYEIDLMGFINGNKCQKCINEEKIKWTKEKIIEYIESFDYKVIRIIEKHGLKTRLEIQCDKNHEPYEIKFDNFKQGYRCPYCKKIVNEEIIADILLFNNLNFKRQYRFDDCRNKLPLPFDFYLPQQNLCIEYNGEQHYKLNRFNMDLLDLMNRKRLDKIKEEYCKDNNIKLITIPYWEKNNIEKILIKELDLK